MARAVLAALSLALLLVPALGAAATAPPGPPPPAGLPADLLALVEAARAHVGAAGNLLVGTAEPSVVLLVSHLNQVFLDLEALVRNVFERTLPWSVALVPLLVDLLVHARDGLEALAFRTLNAAVGAFAGTLGSMCLMLNLTAGIHAVLGAAGDAVRDPPPSPQRLAAAGERVLREGFCMDARLAAWLDVPGASRDGASALAATLLEDADRLEKAAATLWLPGA